MKLKTIILTLIVSALSLFTYELYGQEQRIEMSNTDRDRMDSLQKVDKKIVVQQDSIDKKTIRDAKEASVQTQAKAKEAKRVEQDASDASNQSKKALKSEKKAQKARKDADSQAKKAQEAKDKSDSN